MKRRTTVENKRERTEEIIFLVLIAAFLFAWAAVQQITFSPDEKMRYKVVEYIFRHNALPHGGNPEVLDDSWGISYAFYPMLSYMVSYVFMKLVSIFTMDSQAILVAARMAEVLFGVGTAFYTMKIGKQFFQGAYRKLFVCLVMLLPGAFVLFSYVNCDSLALFATSMLIYSWIRGLEEEWSWRSCARLGVGVSVCALSYYNAYGVILASVVVFCVSILFCEEKKWNISKLLTRGLFITGIVALLAGWWFVRNYILYDGDMLGLNITTVYAEQFAEEARKPSNRYTFQMNPNINIIQMMYFQAPWQQHNWLLMVYYSFIGSFGYMTIWPPEWIGKVFMAFFFIGFLGVLPQLKGMFSLRKASFTEREQICGTSMDVRYTYRLARWNKQAVFHIGLLITMIVPNVLNLFNSYMYDYQPQGRYSMPMLIPLMYVMASGYRWWFGKLKREDRAIKIFTGIVAAGMVLFLLYCYFFLVLPSCSVTWKRLLG